MSMPRTPEEMRVFDVQLVADFRAHDPKLSGRKILLLTTTGARSGQPHTTPMTYVIDGDRVLVIASDAGAVGHPDWYRNLVANPDVTVELPHFRRGPLWPGRGIQPPLGAYRGADAVLHRPPGEDQPQIPVVILERNK